MASIWPLEGDGGIVTYRSILEKGLVAQGHRVECLWHDESRETVRHSDGREIADAGLAPEVDPRIAEIEQQVRWAERRRYLFELGSAAMDLGGYDVIHTQDAISSRAIARIRPPGVAHVATLHGDLVKELEIGMGERFDDLYRAYFAREEHLGATSPHRTIVPSDALRHQMWELSMVPKEQTRVMPYGIDLDLLYAQSLIGDPPLAAAGRIVLLCPARLNAVKGHADLIRAVQLLVESGRNIELWLAGTGGLEEALRQQAGALGLSDRVRFLGHRKDVPALMRRCDAVVLASTQEVLSFALIEAQALGRPVVATRALGIPEAVEDGVTGLLCTPANPEDLAGALGRVVDDCALRARLGANGWRRACRRFSVTRMVSEVLSVYAEAQALARIEKLRQWPGEAWQSGRPPGYRIPDPDFWPLWPVPEPPAAEYRPADGGAQRFPPQMPPRSPLRARLRRP